MLGDSDQQIVAAVPVFCPKRQSFVFVGDKISRPAGKLLQIRPQPSPQPVGEHGRRFGGGRAGLPEFWDFLLLTDLP